MISSLRILVIAVVILLAGGSLLSGQGMILNFSHDKSTYLWEDSVWVDNNISDRFHLNLYNHSTATLITKSLFVDTGDRWQKEANTFASLSYKQWNRFSWGITAQNNYNRLEDRRVTLNRIGLHQDLRISNEIKLKSLVSFSEASRYIDELNDLDQGVMQQLNIDYSDRLLDLGDLSLGYRHNLNLLDRTPEKSFGLNMGFANADSDYPIRLSYEGIYQKNKFFSSLTSFERVTTQNKYEHRGDLEMSLNAFSNLRLDLVSNYNYRRFEYRQDSDDGLGTPLGRDNLTATLYYKLGASYPIFDFSHFRAEYIYRHSDEEFGDIFAGQKIQLGELRLSYQMLISDRDSAYLAATFSVTSYKGKDPEDLFSDRDRSFRMAQGAYQHIFSNNFLMRLKGSYQYLHDIYISEELSSNNNHNILYLAQPEVVWTPFPQLQIENIWLMHANYIYYDYEKYEDSPRNTIYRKADWTSRMNYAFSTRLDIRLSYRFRYEDFGQLIYRDQWSQRISWERKGHLPSIEMEWRPSQHWTINPGYSYERKQSFDHFAGDEEGISLLREKELFKREKIFINIEYIPHDKGIVQLSYTRRVQDSKLYLDEDSDIININVRRYF